MPRKVPLFSRSSFRTPRKTPKRNKSLPNLDESLNYTAESIKAEADEYRPGESTYATGGQSALVMRLGDHTLAFEDGQWSAVGAKGGGAGTREYSKLQKRALALWEENNLLKFKVELLLDMLAASNADCIVLQKELDAMKRSKAHKR